MPTSTCSTLHVPRWQLQQQMVKTFETQRTMGMQQEGESDEIKRVFIEGNPYLLVSCCLLWRRPAHVLLRGSTHA